MVESDAFDRIGQTGRTCRRPPLSPDSGPFGDGASASCGCWFEKGRRPRGRRGLRHEAVYLFGAVCPERDKAVALLLPEVGTTAMQLMLDELGRAVTPDAHAVVIPAGPPGPASFGDGASAAAPAGPCRPAMASWPSQLR
jgi:hypothetical protein